MPEQFRQINEPLFIEVHDGFDDPARIINEYIRIFWKVFKSGDYW